MAGEIAVVAGTNGAGKSTIAGAYFAYHREAYYNPDEHTRELVKAGVPLAEANAAAWKQGFEALRRAIDTHGDFRFETTLGGSSIVAELKRAARTGLQVRVLYVGLATPELHVARVRARVSRGGHDIPESKIRERYSKGLLNLISLLSVVSEVAVFDNSNESADGSPKARNIFRMRDRKITSPTIAELLANTPSWAEPVVASAIQVHNAASAGPRA